MDEITNLWMPVTKTATGKFVGILSDTSLDRDDEFMSKELLDSWVKNHLTIKALANHENKMQSWIGGWNNLKVIEKNGHHALTAEPWFFDKEANPLAYQVQKQVEQALEHGENAGISIGAIPKGSTKKEIEGKNYKVYTDAELLEATWVPVQSNRNASFGHIAKSFDYKIEKAETITKPKQVEDCVKHLIADPNFHPKEGRTKEESAWAVCQSKHGKCAIQEVEKMTEETTKKAETPIVEVPKEEIKKETVLEKDNEISQLKKEIEELKKESTNLRATFEHSATAVKQIKEEFVPTVEGMLKLMKTGRTD